MSEDSGRAGPEARTETSLFEPLLRIKGVLFVSMVLAICVMALDLPFWFRAILLALVVLGAVWAAAGIGNGEDEKVPCGKWPAVKWRLSRASGWPIF